MGVTRADVLEAAALMKALRVVLLDAGGQYAHAPAGRGHAERYADLRWFGSRLILLSQLKPLRQRRANPRLTASSRASGSIYHAQLDQALPRTGPDHPDGVRALA